MSPLTLTFLQ